MRVQAGLGGVHASCLIPFPFIYGPDWAQAGQADPPCKIKRRDTLIKIFVVEPPEGGRPTRGLLPSPPVSWGQSQYRLCV